MDVYKIADKICELCKQKHLTVEMLAEKIGKSPRMVNRYRNGQCKNIPFEVLGKICDALDVDVAYLVASQNTEQTL